MPCQHPTVYPDGNCTLCGVLATTVPGLAEDYHKMIPRPEAENPFGVQRLDGSVTPYPTLTVAFFLSGKGGSIVVKRGRVWTQWKSGMEPL